MVFVLYKLIRVTRIGYIPRFFGVIIEANKFHGRK